MPKEVITMGFFSSLFGRKKKKSIHTEPTQKTKPTATNLNAVSPETAAIITAAAYAMLTAQNPGLAFKITRISKEWQSAGRQKLMDSYKV
jgi:hypothetical protein